MTTVDNLIMTDVLRITSNVDQLISDDIASLAQRGPAPRSGLNTRHFRPEPGRHRSPLPRSPDARRALAARRAPYDPPLDSASLRRLAADEESRAVALGRLGPAAAERCDDGRDDDANLFSASFNCAWASTTLGSLMLPLQTSACLSRRLLKVGLLE